MSYFGHTTSKAHSLLRVVMLLPLVVLPFGGCSGTDPSNFPTAHEADVHPRVAALIEAWVEAQRRGDEHALEELYVHGYDYNGMTAHDMAEVHLLPETHDTRVESITWRLLEAPEHHHHHHAHAHSAMAPSHGHGDHHNSHHDHDHNGHHDHDHNGHHDHDHHFDHHATVMARIQLQGVVSASVLEELATELDDPHDHHHHHHAHSHSAVAPAHGHHHHDHIRGTVKVQGNYDVVFLLVWNHGEPAHIAEQRFETAALEFGGGLAATVLRDIHVHPEDAHPGETLDVHGRYAMLPPGGVIRARVGPAGGGDHDHHHVHAHGAVRPEHGHHHNHENGWVEAEHDHGEFHVHVTAPHHEGEYLVRVEAFGGNVKSRSASLTISEREVHVDDHHHAH